MDHIICSGSPFEIGQQHGSAAAEKVKGSLAFYETFFEEFSGMSWHRAREAGRKWLPFLEESFGDYVDEMKGLASGAGVTFDDILALNVRSEISMGMFTSGPKPAAPPKISDGCTAFSWTPSASTKDDDRQKCPWIIAQNWDWSAAQGANLIHLTIRPRASFSPSSSPPSRGEQSPSAASAKRPVIDMITEAGIIGKIGLNSAGVGVCLNAIRALGVSYRKLPIHLALRAALESTSIAGSSDDGGGEGAGTASPKHKGVVTNGSPPDAIKHAGSIRLGIEERWKIPCVDLLREVGIASAAHILVADTRTGGIGLEASHLDVKVLHPRALGSSEPPTTAENHLLLGETVTHTNHLIVPHAEGVLDQPNFRDTWTRLARVEYLLREHASETFSSSADKSKSSSSSSSSSDTGLPSVEIAKRVLCDEEDYPTGICRHPEWPPDGKESDLATVFSVVMNLTERKGWVVVGRPTQGQGNVLLDPCSEATRSEENH